jgi:hypothetical protein
MSFTFDLIINPIVCSLAILLGALAGFIVGKGKVSKVQSQLYKLECDLLTSNQETLEAQKAFVDLEARLQDQAIPVIPMKIAGTKDNNSKEKSTTK